MKSKEIKIGNPLEGGKKASVTIELSRNVLLDFIQNSNHKYTTAHKKLCLEIIKRIFRRVMEGYRFGGIKISEDGMIIDGNHRYIAYMIAGIEFEIIRGTSSHCDEPRSFNEIIIDEVEDWDHNSESSRRYCTDDFLQDNDFYN